MASSTHSLVPHNPHTPLSSPLDFRNNWSYQDQWNQILNRHNNAGASTTGNHDTVIFDLHWLGEDDTENGNLSLLGCTSGGEVCCWRTEENVRYAVNNTARRIPTTSYDKF